MPAAAAGPLGTPNFGKVLELVAGSHPLHKQCDKECCDCIHDEVHRGRKCIGYVLMHAPEEHKLAHQDLRHANEALS